MTTLLIYQLNNKLKFHISIALFWASASCHRNSRSWPSKRCFSQCIALCNKTYDENNGTTSVSTTGRDSSCLPSGATAVIAGGGIIGCSIAYHLSQEGMKDIVLLDQGRYVIYNIII